MFTGKVELGQGLKTALLQVAAEQLDVAPSRLELITADTERAPNEGFTAGSHSMQDSGTAILHAARQVRDLLVKAAAGRFGLAPAQLQTRDGAVHALDGRTAAYGDLAAGFSLHVPAQPGGPLKDPATLIFPGFCGVVMLSFALSTLPRQASCSPGPSAGVVDCVSLPRRRTGCVWPPRGWHNTSRPSL